MASSCLFSKLKKIADSELLKKKTLLGIISKLILKVFCNYLFPCKCVLHKVFRKLYRVSHSEVCKVNQL